MKHFVAFPSATTSKADECVTAWKAKGYKTLVLLDRNTDTCKADYVLHLEPLGYQKFPGYYKIINTICQRAFLLGADLVTAIGDDMLPPEQGAEWVTKQYFLRFPNGQGVLQGCGDPQGMDGNGVPAAARICGSPTFGKEWARRAYGGIGPFCDVYGSFYGDEDLFNVAKKLGMLWMEPSITILHRHWSWGHMERQPYHERASKSWDVDQAIFNARKARGFPGSELA